MHSSKYLVVNTDYSAHFDIQCCPYLADMQLICQEIDREIMELLRS